MPTRSLACSVFALSPESWINAAYSSACVLSRISNVKHIIEVSLRLARVAVSQNNAMNDLRHMSRCHGLTLLSSWFLACIKHCMLNINRMHKSLWWFLTHFYPSVHSGNAELFVGLIDTSIKIWPWHFVCRNMTLKMLKTFSWKRYFVKLNGYFLLVNLRNIVIEKCPSVSAHYEERRGVWSGVCRLASVLVVTQRAVCWSPGLGSSAYRVLVITLQTIQGVC